MAHDDLERDETETGICYKSPINNIAAKRVSVSTTSAMNINKDSLQQNIRRMPEEFSSQEFCKSFRENYPLEFSQWVRFHINKYAADEESAVHSTIQTLKFELSHRCLDFVVPLESGRWKKKWDTRF